MSRSDFIDFYEVLEVSPKANSETIERVFRYLAQRCHPDVSESSDRARFNLLVEAYNTLKDPESRVAYDLEHENHQKQKADLLTGAESTGSDSDERFRLLTLFYAQRRRDMKQPGVSMITMEQILGCPTEVLEFHVWYFREKGWVKREESGLLSITALGVDEIESCTRRQVTGDRLITDKTQESSSSTRASARVPLAEIDVAAAIS